MGIFLTITPLCRLQAPPWVVEGLGSHNQNSDKPNAFAKHVKRARGRLVKTLCFLCIRILLQMTGGCQALKNIGPDVKLSALLCRNSFV